MLEKEPTSARFGYAAAGYSYPGDLARFVRDRWENASPVLETPGGIGPLPDAAALAGFFAACYQASMLREEERPVVFRAVLAEPPSSSTPKGDRPRTCSGSPLAARSPSTRGSSGSSRWPPTCSGR